MDDYLLFVAKDMQSPMLLAYGNTDNDVHYSVLYGANIAINHTCGAL